MFRPTLPRTWLPLAVLLVVPPCAARAGVIVIPPDNAAVEGDFFANRPLAETAQTTQFAYPGSFLAGLPAGSVVTGLRFRLDQNRIPGPTNAVSFADYTVVLSQSNFAPGSLSLTFADNIGADAVTVMSGPLEIQAGAFPGGGGPNPFGPLFAFDTPYTYAGGDLLVTIRHAGSQFETLTVDFQSLSGMQNIFANGASATTADGSVSGGVVMELEFTSPAAVPEPGTLTLLGVAVGSLGLARRLRLFRKRNEVTRN